MGLFSMGYFVFGFIHSEIVLNCRIDKCNPFPWVHSSPLVKGYYNLFNNFLVHWCLGSFPVFIILCEKCEHPYVYVFAH